MAKKSPQNQLSKNAKKRQGNLVHKACRARSWLRGEAKKARNRAEQNARETANKTREIKPWDAAKAARYAKRH